MFKAIVKIKTQNILKVSLSVGGLFFPVFCLKIQESVSLPMDSYASIFITYSYKKVQDRHETYGA